MDLLVDMFVSYSPKWNVYLLFIYLVIRSYLHIKLVSFEDGDKRIVWSKRFPQSIFIVDSYITEQGAMRGGQVLHVMGAILFIPFAIFVHDFFAFIIMSSMGLYLVESYHHMATGFFISYTTYIDILCGHVDLCTHPLESF